eukprot:1073644-Lingulodinium_polyedra.AAC.1
MPMFVTMQQSAGQKTGRVRGWPWEWAFRPPTAPRMRAPYARPVFAPRIRAPYTRPVYAPRKAPRAAPRARQNRAAQARP